MLRYLQRHQRRAKFTHRMAMASRSRVRVLSVTHVRPDQLSSRRAGDDEHAAITLSFFDAIHVARRSMQRLFFYEGPGLPPYASLVSSLRSSLAATLAVFSPLAGQLSYRPSTGDVFIDCSPAAVSCGVRFVEAEYAGTVEDMHRLARGDEHHMEALMQLGPESEAARLPIPVLAVQVTMPAGGDAAVVVGVTIHHAAADGHSVWQFMRAWSAASREGSPSAPELTFHRTAIRHPKAAEMTRKTLRAIAPTLPVARSPSSCTPPDQRRRTFDLRVDQIQSLKERILRQSVIADGHQPVAVKHPSTFVAVSSLAWTSIVRAKSSLHDADDAYYLVAVDCRRRLVPPVGEGYFGNCTKACFARAAVGDLRGEAGLARAAAAIQVVVRELSAGGDPLADMEGWTELFLGIPRERLTTVGSSNRFMAYDDTDFGWGAPSRAELVSVSTKELVLLLGAADGGVQVTVALDHTHMDGFVDNFLQ